MCLYVYQLILDDWASYQSKSVTDYHLESFHIVFVRLFVCLVDFGFALFLFFICLVLFIRFYLRWAIQPPVSGHSGSVGHGLPLVAWPSHLTCHFCPFPLILCHLDLSTSCRQDKL